MAAMHVCDDLEKLVVPGEMTELVRGQEKSLLEKLEPLVRSENVALDLSGIERVDAAGLSALITLYRDAFKAGHEFRVTRPGRHVREVLAVVGLDRILSGSDAENDRNRSEKTAA